jgi:hypothetical protein
MKAEKLAEPLFCSAVILKERYTSGSPSFTAIPAFQWFPTF